MIVVGLNKICTFVKQNHFRRNSKINIYDKSAPTVLSSERAVIPFLKWFCTPKGALAYKFFKMQNKKNFVSNSQRAALTPAQKRNQKNQQTLNSLIVEYVQLCLDNSTIIKGPIRKEYLKIYNQSLKPAAL